MRLLGIETSCDDTSVGIVAERRNGFVVEANVTASQILIHRKYGGVVPEVAAREHAVTILPTIHAALARAQRSWDDINAIAVTAGPGLNTALLVGVETARALGYALQKPIVRINHIEGHVVSGLIGRGAKSVRFPAVALVVSGGHTELISIKSIGQYKLLGATVDDAVGEAFDKTAKILGLSYPGGPEISKRAEKGNALAFPFPRAFMTPGNLNFSYSGLKTSVLYAVQDRQKRTPKFLADICAGFQAAAIEPLVKKSMWALEKTGAKTFLLGGGVAANNLLRHDLTRMIQKESPRTSFVCASREFCADNGAMIAVAGMFHAKKKDFTSWKTLNADPNWELV